MLCATGLHLLGGLKAATSCADGQGGGASEGDGTSECRLVFKGGICYGSSMVPKLQSRPEEYSALF